MSLTCSYCLFLQLTHHQTPSPYLLHSVTVNASSCFVSSSLLIRMIVMIRESCIPFIRSSLLYLLPGGTFAAQRAPRVVPCRWSWRRVTISEAVLSLSSSPNRHWEFFPQHFKVKPSLEVKIGLGFLSTDVPLFVIRKLYLSVPALRVVRLHHANGLPSLVCFPGSRSTCSLIWNSRLQAAHTTTPFNGFTQHRHYNFVLSWGTGSGPVKCMLPTCFQHTHLIVSLAPWFCGSPPWILVVSRAPRIHCSRIQQVKLGWGTLKLKELFVV
jgi:hypothetical protein